MKKSFFLIAIFFLFDFINAQMKKEYDIKSLYYKDTVKISTPLLPKVDLPKPDFQKKFFYFGKIQETIYRDNLTNRIYFENGANRTLIYSRKVQ